jgi:serine/threonine protein kinase
MERLTRDLHAALKNKLPFQIRYLFFYEEEFFDKRNILLFRIRIALDVVEGLRYLHGLGLVHRDIKLKNVLVRYL